MIVHIYSLSYNEITSKGGIILFETMKQHKYIEFIDLNKNYIDDECMESLSDFLKDNQTIKGIHIGGYSFKESKITDKGIEILSNGLIGNICLNKLYLEHNKGITGESIDLLKEISMKSDLKEINLDMTSISRENQREIDNLLRIPIDEREIPVHSMSKSAAKVSYYN